MSDCLSHHVYNRICTLKKYCSPPLAAAIPTMLKEIVPTRGVGDVESVPVNVYDEVADPALPGLPDRTPVLAEITTEPDTPKAVSVPVVTVYVIAPDPPAQVIVGAAAPVGSGALPRKLTDPPEATKFVVQIRPAAQED